MALSLAAQESEGCTDTFASQVKPIPVRAFVLNLGLLFLIAALAALLSVDVLFGAGLLLGSGVCLTLWKRGIPRTELRPKPDVVE